MTSNTPVLEVKNLFFKYPSGDYVLRGLNLVVDKGEHVLIIGDTGSGKTTLARVLTNTAPTIYGGHVEGLIKIMGKRLDELNSDEPRREIFLIGQNPYLFFVEPLVREDLYNYALRVHRNHEHAEKALRKAIESTGIHKLVDKYFYELSGGEARRVQVAKSLISDPALLLFDEPLMWLDDKGVNDFLNLLRLMRNLGKSVIVFEHRFLSLMRSFDKVYLLSKGRLHDVTELAWRLIKKPYSPRTDPNQRRSSDENAEVILEAIDIHHVYNGNSVLRGINLKIRRQDFILIYGLNGSGKTTLLKILAGYLKPSKGTVKKHCDIIYIPQNTILFFTEETIEKEVNEICKTRNLGDNCVREGLRILGELGFDVHQSPFNLSHGQMVKLAVTLAQLTRAKLILLDEPFSGLTYVDRVKLLEHLKRLGITVVLTVSNLDAYQEEYWTKTYSLDNGLLVEINLNKFFSLDRAAWLYEELKNGVSD